MTRSGYSFYGKVPRKEWNSKTQKHDSNEWRFIPQEDPQNRRRQATHCGENGALDQAANEVNLRNSQQLQIGYIG